MHPEQQRSLDYLARKGTKAKAEELRQQVRHAFGAMEADLDAVTMEARDTPPAPGKWSPHQILDHLVLSHGPAIPQLTSLLAGITPEGVAIPADLDTPPHLLRPWDELRAQLGAIHAEIEELIGRADDNVSLEPKAVVEMVVKVDGQPVHWHAPVDWKAFVQGIRVHVLEHRDQLRRAIASTTT